MTRRKGAARFLMIEVRSRTWANGGLWNSFGFVRRDPDSSDMTSGRIGGSGSLKAGTAIAVSPAMNRLALAPGMLLLFTGCASMQVAPDPDLPRRLDGPSAKELYDAYKLVCEDGECRQGNETYPVQAFERTRLTAPRLVLARSRHARKATAWAFGGIGIASAAGAAFSGFNYLVVDDDEGLKTATIGLGIASAVMAATAILVNGVWQDPTEELEQAYNAQLLVDLDRRVAAGKAPRQKTENLTVAEKRCLSDSMRASTKVTRAALLECLHR